MAIKDLIATPGDIAASRITRLFDYTGEAHSRLFGEIKEAVDSAVAAEREACLPGMRRARPTRTRPVLGTRGGA